MGGGRVAEVDPVELLKPSEMPKVGRRAVFVASASAFSRGVGNGM
jgi:hypothetical protein